MKDRTITAMVTIMTAAAASACSAGIPEYSTETEVTGETAEVRIMISGHEYEDCTKSSFRWQDDGISDVEIVITDEEGKIVDVLYSNTPSGLSFRGKVGSRYMIWAAANIGGKINVLELKDFTSGARSVSYSQIMSSGIPMYSVDPETGYPGPCTVMIGKSTGTVTLDMVRMMAKINFKTDLSRLKEPESFIVSSIKLYNAVSTYSPFAREVRQSRGGGIDYSFDYASKNDLVSVNKGGTITLYAFENMQGDLLPGNTDPWAKVPSSIGHEGDCCSYLEMNCSYSTGGISCDDITYRMYLGEDAVTNFDVRRNTRYSITLYPTEEEIDGHRGSWKVESSEWDDSRRLRFNPSELTVQARGSAVTTVFKSPSDLEYTLTADGFQAAGLSWYRNGDQITVTSSTDITSQKTATLRATTADGQHSDECVITVVPATVLTKISISPTSASINEGETQTYKVTAHYSDMTTSIVTSKCSWVSDDNRTATVSGGTARGLNAGTAHITATYNGMKAISTLTVTENHVPVITHELVVTPEDNTLTEGESVSLKATYYTITDGTRDSGTDVTTSATWTVTSGASFISATTVKGRYAWAAGPGTSTVKAAYSDCEDTATISTSGPDEYLITVKSQ